MILAHPAYDLTSSLNIRKTPDLDISGWVCGVNELEIGGGVDVEAPDGVETPGLLVDALEASEVTDSRFGLIKTVVFSLAGLIK